MQISAVKLYEQTGTDEANYTLMPFTANLDGMHNGVGIIDFTLGLMIRVYLQKEIKNELESLEDQEWARIRELNQFMRNKENEEEERDMMEYGILKCHEFGYINVTYYDNVRYFNLTKKCENPNLYKPGL